MAFRDVAGVPEFICGPELKAGQREVVGVPEFVRALEQEAGQRDVGSVRRSSPRQRSRGPPDLFDPKKKKHKKNTNKNPTQEQENSTREQGV